MNQRTIDSLRRLAERPGTEHEGNVARSMLEKALKQPRQPDEVFHAVLNKWASNHYWDTEQEPLWECPCGDTIYANGKCVNRFRHLEVQTEIRARFKPGDRVFYNYWAYSVNCPGKIAAYIKIKDGTGTHPWAWISIRFDHLKSARQAPIFSARGWHLSHEPLDLEEAERLRCA